MENTDNSSPVQDFFRGKNIFITGATGFLGMALIEKLLRACPDVGTIYVLVRPKKDKEVSARLEELIKNPVSTDFPCHQFFISTVDTKFLNKLRNKISNAFLVSPVQSFTSCLQTLSFTFESCQVFS